ncbi:MAG: hypothetical protein J6Q10_03085 [Clostridia bacterium]|nr:hypothetical protein [Clostridia bacterium]
MTNYEKIKAMSVEEMAEYFADSLDCVYCPAKSLCRKKKLLTCVENFLLWLESEVEEDG